MTGYARAASLCDVLGGQPDGVTWVSPFDVSFHEVRQSVEQQKALGDQQKALAKYWSLQNAYRPRPSYDKAPLPLPVPFCWGPNGALILLGIMEAPLLIALVILGAMP